MSQVYPIEIALVLYAKQNGYKTYNELINGRITVLRNYHDEGIINETLFNTMKRKLGTTLILPGSIYSSEFEVKGKKVKWNKTSIRVKSKSQMQYWKTFKVNLPLLMSSFPYQKKYVKKGIVSHSAKIGSAHDEKYVRQLYRFSDEFVRLCENKGYTLPEDGWIVDDKLIGIMTLWEKYVTTMFNILVDVSKGTILEASESDQEYADKFISTSEDAYDGTITKIVPSEHVPVNKPNDINGKIYRAYSLGIIDPEEMIIERTYYYVRNDNPNITKEEFNQRFRNREYDDLIKSTPKLFNVGKPNTRYYDENNRSREIYLTDGLLKGKLLIFSPVIKIEIGVGGTSSVKFIAESLVIADTMDAIIQNTSDPFDDGHYNAIEEKLGIIRENEKPQSINDLLAKLTQEERQINVQDEDDIAIDY
jgi:hypothetical protein